MSVPFKKKLSYAWARVTHRDRLYSHVFEDKSSFEKVGERFNFVGGAYNAFQKYTYNVLETHNNWLIAKPIKGEKDAFRIYNCSYTKYSSDYKKNYSETSLPGVYNREAALEYIKTQEKTWLDSKKLPTQKQPFSKKVGSELSALKK